MAWLLVQTSVVLLLACPLLGQGSTVIPLTLGGQTGTLFVDHAQLSWHSFEGRRGLHGTLPFEEGLDATQSGAAALVLGRHRPADTCGLALVERRGQGLLRVVASHRYGFVGATRVVNDAVRGHLYLISFNDGEGWTFRCARWTGRLPEESEFTVAAVIPGPRYGAWSAVHADPTVGGLRSLAGRLVERDGRWTIEGGPGNPARTFVGLDSDLIVQRELFVRLSEPTSLLLEPRRGTAALPLGNGIAGRHGYPLPRGLDLGTDYRVVALFASGRRESDWMTPRVEAGVASTSGVFTQPGRMLYVPQRCYVDSGMFGIVGQFKATVVASSPSAFAWFRVTDEAAPPPVVERNGVTWLQVGPGIDVPITIKDPVGPEGPEGKLAVPSCLLLHDASAAGRMLYFQLCATSANPAGRYVSEVVGLKVRPSNSPDIRHVAIRQTTIDIWRRQGLDEAAVLSRLQQAGW